MSRQYTHVQELLSGVSAMVESSPFLFCVFRLKPVRHEHTHDFDASIDDALNLFGDFYARFLQRISDQKLGIFIARFFGL
jgi:hypothetical protein